MQSSVGNAQVYNDGDQKTHSGGAAEEGKPAYEAGQPNSHQNLDSKDERSIANKLAAASKAKDEEKKTIEDPLEPARSHGNEPSRGAKIDAEIQKEEEELLRKKGAA